MLEFSFFRKRFFFSLTFSFFTKKEKVPGKEH